MPRTPLSAEDAKLAKAKKQLLVIGVVCTAVIIFMLWLVNLRAVLSVNRATYNPTLNILRSAPTLKQAWQEFNAQLKSR